MQLDTYEYGPTIRILLPPWPQDLCRTDELSPESWKTIEHIEIDVEKLGWFCHKLVSMCAERTKREPNTIFIAMRHVDYITHDGTGFFRFDDILIGKWCGMDVYIVGGIKDSFAMRLESKS